MKMKSTQPKCAGAVCYGNATQFVQVKAGEDSEGAVQTTAVSACPERKTAVGSMRKGGKV